MAESADILTSDEQRVILPNMHAGCSMADMAALDEVEIAWEEIYQSQDSDHNGKEELVSNTNIHERRCRVEGFLWPLEELSAPPRMLLEY